MSSSDEQENITYLWVAETVLRQQQRPLTAGEIVQIGLDDGLFGDRPLSRTPQKSMQARLSMEILNNKTRSRFLRTGRGSFSLRSLVEEELGRKPEIGVEEYIPPRRAPLPPTEQVLVVGRRDYETILDFQGIDFNYDQIIKQLISAPSLRYIPRAQAETNDEYKQFITYTIIQSDRRVLSFRRGSYNRAPSMIRGARCIGFGGHVNEDDFSLLTYKDRGIRANASREIREELKLNNQTLHVDADKIEPIGVLNDDSSEIGRRHFALILRYSPDNVFDWRNPTRGEASINDLRWLPLERNQVNLSEFEYWSQLCLRKLFPSDVSCVASYTLRRRSIFSKPHALCVVGSIGSGKSIATSIIQAKCGYSVINSGCVLADLMNIPPVPYTARARFQQQAKEFMDQKDGAERLARAIINRLNELPSNRVIIDGIRHKATMDQLRRYSPLGPAIIYVQTPPDVAFDLYRNREEIDISLADFMRIYNAPAESSVRYLISDADAVLYNWQGLDGYKRVIHSFIDESKLYRGV